MANTPNQWYPYYKVQESFYDLSNTTTLLRRITDYIIDAPNGSYTPIDDNARARTRFWKYLYYDTPRPLEKVLPTIKQKMKLVYDAEKASEPKDNEKGYRLIPQMFIKQEQTKAQTQVFFYIGRTIPSDDDQSINISIIFDILSNVSLELNTKDENYTRCFNIEQCLIQAFHGVNMEGIGTFYFSKTKHADCGSSPISDGEENVGRRLIMALEIPTTKDNEHYEDTDNLIPVGENIFLI